MASITDVEPVGFNVLQLEVGEATTREVLRTFGSFISELVSELQSAVNNKNTSQAGSTLHELSSSCGVVGATELQQLALAMDEQLQKSDWKSLDASMKALTKQARVVKYYIGQLLG